METVTNKALYEVVNDMFKLVMSRTTTHKALALLLKNHVRHSERLKAMLITVLRSKMRDFYEDILSPMDRDRNLCFVNFLTQLFEKDVIDEKLIIESLETFMEEWGDTSDACFTAMFTRIDEKLQPKVTKEKLKEFTDHFEGYIIVNHIGEGMPKECQEYLDRKMNPNK